MFFSISGFQVNRKSTSRVFPTIGLEVSPRLFYNFTNNLSNDPLWLDSTRCNFMSVIV